MLRLNNRVFFYVLLFIQYLNEIDLSNFMKLCVQQKPYKILILITIKFQYIYLTVLQIKLLQKRQLKNPRPIITSYKKRFLTFSLFKTISMNFVDTEVGYIQLVALQCSSTLCVYPIIPKSDSDFQLEVVCGI